MFMKRLKLKVLAFGNQLMQRRLVSQLDEDEVAVTGCCEVAEVVNQLNKEHFDIIIVDHKVNEAERMCRYVRTLTRAPVAILMQENFADWHTLRKFEVNGYLPDDKSSEEFMARLRAYSRRGALVEQV
jgi:DNA-binding response OmpR family regulator